jgi:RNA polymerase sigma factor (sigma-70 family)
MSLYTTILTYQQGGIINFKKLYRKFKPLIIKYGRRLDETEDGLSEITLHFIKVIQTFPLRKFKITDEGAIFNYIAKSIYHSYIVLLKTQTLKKSAEFPTDIIHELSYSTLSQTDTYDLDSFWEKTIKNNLTKRQYTVIYMKYYLDKSDVEIAKTLAVTKQAIFKVRKQALKKLKEIIQEVERDD